MPKTPRFLAEAEVESHLRTHSLIAALKQALIDFSAGRIQQPVRSVLKIPEQNGWFALMPAVLADVMGAKLVTVYPGNAELGVPTHLATIQLFDCRTGEPLAIMDGRLITEKRTAAVSAIATDLLAPAGARVLAILGSGVQAKAHLEALREVRSFTEVRVWSRTAEHARRFSKENGIQALPTAQAAVEDADVVVTVTGAAEPILHGQWLKKDVYVNAVGAVGPTRREVDTETMKSTVIVDSREAALKESGDVLLAGAEIYAELGEILAGKPLPRKNGRVIFKSLGIAAEDIAAARLIYQAVR